METAFEAYQPSGAFLIFILPSILEQREFREGNETRGLLVKQERSIFFSWDTFTIPVLVQHDADMKLRGLGRPEEAVRVLIHYGKHLV